MDELNKLSEQQITPVKQQLTFPLDKTSQDIIRRYSAGEAFPVGSIFTSVVSTDPSILLGYGTWSAIGAGRVPVGVDTGDTDFDTPKETGGAKTVTLTTDQIPSHSHTTMGVNRPDGSQGTNQVGFGSSTIQGYLTTGLEGGGQSHSNLQPYFCVYFWERTA